MKFITSFQCIKMNFMNISKQSKLLLFTLQSASHSVFKMSTFLQHTSFKLTTLLVMYTTALVLRCPCLTQLCHKSNLDFSSFPRVFSHYSPSLHSPQPLDQVQILNKCFIFFSKKTFQRLFIKFGIYKKNIS